MGVGHIGRIRETSEGRRAAIYDRYLRVSPPLSFDAIVGDPRVNAQNSIASVRGEPCKRLLQNLGIASIEELPDVSDEVRETVREGSEPRVSEWFIREELQRRVLLDLLGPAEDEAEELKETKPSSRYLVGKLAPKKRQERDTGDDAAAEADQLDHTTGESAEENQDERWETAAKRIISSSMGLSFSVAPGTSRLEIEVEWGSYQRTESETEMTDSGKGRSVWRRRQVREVHPIDLRRQYEEPLAASEGESDVQLWIRARTEEPQGRSVSVFLVNNQVEPPTSRDEAWLFQTRIAVRHPEGAPVFVRRPRPAGLEDPEADVLDMIYRRNVEFAVGHGVSVDWSVDGERYDRSTEIRTVCVPVAEVPQTDTPLPSTAPTETRPVLDMKKLAEMPADEVAGSLELLVDMYESWIRERQDQAQSRDLEAFAEPAGKAIARAEDAATRMREGIETLRTNATAQRAFQFANEAMWQQRIHSDLVAAKVRGENASLEEKDTAENRSWRPFQLGFILALLPSLSSPEHPDRSADPSAIADLLWFPTGGGKTEAYLGAAAFTIAMRRLQGVVEGHDGSHGVSVFTRYTLRLLTVQQFQRTTALVCAMEQIRKRDIERGSNDWGSEPMRIGLWVGNQVTPGSTAQAQDAIKAESRLKWKGAGRGSPLQLGRCPWCGAEIRAHDVDVRTGPKDIGLTITYCSDENGVCPFSRKNSSGHGVPLLVVDEEIYHHPPDILIATVDKFAQMPWDQRVRSLFGRVDRKCERHGYIAEGEVHHQYHQAVTIGRQHLGKAEMKPAMPLRPPDLIIQDELHLINGPLGTIAGLYETAIDELCSWEVAGRKVRPKLVASTATVRQAEEQVHRLFLRSVRIFPPVGLDVEDQFFAVRKPVSEEAFGRRYMGICAPGYARPAVLIRVYTAFVTAAEALYREYGRIADPWTTVLGYFNSLRELGGMRRLVEDDVRTRAFRIEKGQESRPGLSQRDVRVVDELTSRRSSTEIPKILSQLERPYAVADAVGDAHPAARRRKKGDPRALDVVLSTNMVSVGVDVRRLGLMIVNGQPKTTAEYIQATSRIGRAHPGLVCTVLNWARPRDASHYETFRHYHETYYKHVEALAVTPFSRHAVERSGFGVIVSLMRLLYPDLAPEEAAEKLTDQADDRIKEVRTLIEKRAELALQSQSETGPVADIVQKRLDMWTSIANEPHNRLGYTMKKDDRVPLIHEPTGTTWNQTAVARSMRNVEPTLPLMLYTRLQTEFRGWESPSSDESEVGTDDRQ